MDVLHKTQTGIAAEFLVAGELARRNYTVTLTFGNTKAIDLLVEKNGRLIPIQVKGIQRKKSICWNIKNTAILPRIIYVLVNLHADTGQQPDYFIFTSAEIAKNLKQVKSGRDYIDYNFALRLNAKDAWHKIK